MTSQQLQSLRKLRALTSQHPSWQPFYVAKLREVAAQTGQDEYELLQELP